MGLEPPDPSDIDRPRRYLCASRRARSTEARFDRPDGFTYPTEAVSRTSATSVGGPETFYVSLSDNLRDWLIFDRLQTLLTKIGSADHLLPLLDRPKEGIELSDEAFAQIRSASGIICLYSREADTSYWVQLELYVASALGKPGCLVIFPEVPFPSWMTGSVFRVELEGFKDSGPGLPPGTDEGQFFHRSVFAEHSLRSIVAFVEGVRAHRLPALPEIPRPRPELLRERRIT